MKYRNLNHIAINGENLKNKIGVYVLAKTQNSQGKYIIRYVGRSTDLDTRLKTYVGDYTYFGYETFSTENQAYRRELAIYNQHNPSDNLITPAAPSQP